MRRLVVSTVCRSCSGPAAAVGSAVSSPIRAENATNCRASSSESRCAFAGLSAVPEILMMLPSVTSARTRLRSSSPSTPSHFSAAAVRSVTTVLVAISAWVSSTRSSQAPGSSTDADVE